MVTRGADPDSYRLLTDGTDGAAGWFEGGTPSALWGVAQAASSIAGAEPGRGFPAVSAMRQAAKPPITAAPIM